MAFTPHVKHYISDGTKSVPLSALPEEAWTYISGGDSNSNETVKLYRSVAFLFRCVHVRANSVAGVPWAIYRRENEIWSSEDDEAPSTLSWAENLPELLWLTEAALCLTATAYYEQSSNLGRNKRMLSWLAPQTMRPQWDREAGLTHFKRTLGNTVIDMAVEDVVYHRLPNPMHETEPGTPPAQAAMAGAGVIYNVDLFAEAFFKRGAIKATLLTVKNMPVAAERERLKAWWKRFFSGVKNAFEAEVVNADAVMPVIVGEGIKELSDVQLTTEKREDIATAMGVPHSLVLSNAANYATSQQDEMNFYNQTIIPACKLISRQQNKQLWGPLGYRLQFEPQKMSIFQEDEEQRSGSLKNYVDAGLPLEMAAEILGVQLPDGIPDYAALGAILNEKQAERDARAREITAQMQPQAPAQNGAPNVVDEQRQEEIRRFKTWAKKRDNPNVADFKSDLLTDADKRSLLGEATDAGFFLWAGKAIPDGVMSIKEMLLQLDPDDDEAEQSARMDIEGQAEDELATALESQRRALIPGNSPPDDAEDIVRRVEPTSERVRDVLRRMLIASADLGIAVAVSQFDSIGFGFDWTLANTDARDWANRYAGELIRNINDTTRRQVRQVVSAWIENGDPLPALIRELAPTFGRQRAQLIASTEVTRAYAEANRRAYQASGVVQEMQWRTANDERVCPVCGPLHDKRTRLDGNFEGGIESPPAHPNCRCWIVPVIEEP